MFAHMSIGVSNLERSAAFYDAIMTALGFVRVLTTEESIGYGLQGTKNDRLMLLAQSGPVTPPANGFHLAFKAMSQKAVDAFYDAALQNGGTDQGAPGLRAHYGPDYYAAFVLDPDGYKLEAKFPPPEAGPEQEFFGR